MQFSAAFFEQRIRERLEAERAIPPAPLPAATLGGWDAARVSEFLNSELDASACPPPVVIAGAGGHAKVAIEILEESRAWRIAACTSDGGPGAALLGIPVPGDDQWLPGLRASGIRHAFAAIGDNRARLDAMARLQGAGFHLINAVSRRATVSPRVRLGCGVAIMPGAVVNVDTELGDGVIVNTGATVDHDCRVGRGVHIAPGANVAGRVSIGEGAFLGAGCRVIDGMTIGAWTVVGAGAVVVRHLPEGVVAVGVPASVRVRRDGGPMLR
jgi:UDP-perosamine 4-acetyltransferase